MQIVVKAAKDSDQDPLEIITRNVAETLGDQEEKAVVSKVFPDQTSGNRARLYTVHLPDYLPAKDVSRVVERLSSQEALEYAEVPAPRRPMGSSR
jgi:hypothetical protein